MTAEQVHLLKVGERLLWRQANDNICTVHVTALTPEDPRPYFYRRPAWHNYAVRVCRIGRTRDGKRYPATMVFSCCLDRMPGAKTCETANVFADWLDDQGEHTAAEKLRAAFPIQGWEDDPAVPK